MTPHEMLMALLRHVAAVPIHGDFGRGTFQLGGLEIFVSDIVPAGMCLPIGRTAWVVSTLDFAAATGRDLEES